MTVENEGCTSETIQQAQETLTALKKYKWHASVQHRSHVPKFGDWERDNVRYTTNFEDARKAKAVEKMNPDDPKASVNGLEGQDSIQDSFDVDSDKNKSAEGHRGDGNVGHNLQETNTQNPQKSESNHKIIMSESDSDKSNSSHSLVPSNHQRIKSDRKKSLHGHSGQRNGSYTFNELHYRGVPIPKFGDWDELDPASGEGFTAIFEKLKEEKQIVASAEVPAQTSTHLDSKTKTNKKGSSHKSKMFCCLTPSRSGRH